MLLVSRGCRQVKSNVGFVVRSTHTNARIRETLFHWSLGPEPEHQQYIRGFHLFSPYKTTTDLSIVRGIDQNRINTISNHVSEKPYYSYHAYTITTYICMILANLNHVHFKNWAQALGRYGPELDRGRTLLYFLAHCSHFIAERLLSLNVLHSYSP